MVRWTLLFVVLIIFGSGAVAFYTVFFRPSGEAVVPPLRERSVVEAVAEAERLGFAYPLSFADAQLMFRSGNPRPQGTADDIIAHGKNDTILHIDCGCVYGYSLGCIRLEDMQEFYVPSTYPKPY